MKQWYILFTNYENSLATMKTLAKSQLPKGCGAYIPVTISENKFHKSRIYNKAMYPFYLFVCCTDESQLKILLKKMTALNIEGYFLRNNDGSYATLTSDEIRNLETNYKITEDTIVGHTYAIGDVITVKNGPMTGITGPITSISDTILTISYVMEKDKQIDLPVFVSDLQPKQEPIQ
jgi:transcription antitermination factor NusG